MNWSEKLKISYKYFWPLLILKKNVLFGPKNVNFVPENVIWREDRPTTKFSKFAKFLEFSIFFCWNICRKFCSIEISLVPLGVRIFEVGFLTLTMIFIYSVGRNVLVNTDGIRSRSLGMERVPCPTDIPKRTLPQSRVRFPSYSCFSSYNITRLG